MERAKSWFDLLWLYIPAALQLCRLRVCHRACAAAQHTQRDFSPRFVFSGIDLVIERNRTYKLTYLT